MKMDKRIQKEIDKIIAKRVERELIAVLASLSGGGEKRKIRRRRKTKRAKKVNKKVA